MGPCLWLALLVVVIGPGCRAISRYGENRQSVAARRLSRQGLEAMHAGQWDVAEGLFTSALELTAGDDRAHWGMAEALWQRGDLDAAANHLETAVRLSDSDPRLVRRLGEVYLQMQRLEEADQQSLLALQADRQSPESWKLRGDCLVAAGDLPAALAAYHRALALRPDFPAAQLQIAEIYRQQQRYDRLLATVDRLQDTIGDEAECPCQAHVLRGVALQHLHRQGDARRCFEDAIRVAPENPEPYLHLAALLLETGDHRSASEPLRTAIALAPRSPEAIALARRVHRLGTSSANDAIGLDEQPDGVAAEKKKRLANRRP